MIRELDNLIDIYKESSSNKFSRSDQWSGYIAHLTG